jgi:hypothetical protein
MPFNELFASGECELVKGARPRFTFHVRDLGRVQQLLRGMFVELTVRTGPRGALAFCLDVPDRNLGPWAIPVREAVRLKLARGKGDCQARIEGDGGELVYLSSFCDGLVHDWSGKSAQAFDRLASGDPETARELLVTVAARPAPPPSAHHLLGRCLRALGHTEEAIASYRAAVRASCDGEGRLAPWAAGPLSDMGVAYKRKGDPARAVHCLLHALHLRPNQPETLLSFFSLMALDESYVLFGAARVLALQVDGELVDEFLESYSGFSGRDARQLRAEAQRLAAKIDLLEWPFRRPGFGKLASFERGLCEAEPLAVAGAPRWGPGSARA